MALTTVLDFTHARNHAGRMFEAGVTASGSTTASLMITPATGKDVHAIFSAYSAAAMTMRLWEDVANSASSGSAFTPVCKNRCVPEKLEQVIGRVASRDILEATKAKRRAGHARLDPFALKKGIEVKLKKSCTALGNLNREATMP